jgi:hypothetical protein
MKRLAILPILFLLLSTMPARAEKPLSNGLGANGTNALLSPGDVKATPEMWFYDQAMREYKDPQMAVRAKADLRAQSRQHRLESMKWFGLSNTRPRACSDPYHADYSPGWVSNPGFYPSRWNGITTP